MTNNNSQGVSRGCWAILFILIMIVGVSIVDFCESCDNNKTNESSVSTKTHHSSEKQIIETYKENRLDNGTQPYPNESFIYGEESEIELITSGTSNSDVVVILQQNGLIVRNEYVRAGSSIIFSIQSVYEILL